MASRYMLKWRRASWMANTGAEVATVETQEGQVLAQATIMKCPPGKMYRPRANCGNLHAQGGLMTKVEAKHWAEKHIESWLVDGMRSLGWTMEGPF